MWTRREFLRDSATGFGLLALAAMMAERARGGTDSPASTPHFAPRARGVIFCFMDGGPSHVDTFDYKPLLEQRQGEKIGDQAVSKLSQSTANRVWLGSPWHFQQRGQSGLWVSDLLPHLAGCAADLCVVRSLVGRQPLHGQQNLLLHTGRVTGGAPSVGSWVLYGLGTESDELPGYVLLNNDWIPNGGLENFSSAFLPANFGATMVRARGNAVDNVSPTDAFAVQRRKLNLLQEQDNAFAEENQQNVVALGAMIQEALPVAREKVRDFPLGGNALKAMETLLAGLEGARGAQLDLLQRIQSMPKPKVHLNHLEDFSIYIPARKSALRGITRFEKELGGPMPLLLIAWYEQIEAISLVGTHRGINGGPGFFADAFAMMPLSMEPLRDFRSMPDAAAIRERIERQIRNHFFDLKFKRIKGFLRQSNQLL
jgi:hypothetical protein